MAVNKKQKKSQFAKQNKMIGKLVNNIQSGIDSLYNNTYYSQVMNRRDLEVAKNSIDLSIDKIISNNMNNIGSPNISQLYSRMQLKSAQKDAKTIKELEDVFSDQGLMDTVLTQYSQNKYLKDFDNDIDTICKYMPQLDEALEIKKDNVLSADHFSKDFLTITPDTIAENSDFDQNIKDIKTRYKLLELCEECYSNTARYGEQFLYVVPYAKAITRLMKNRQAGVSFGLNIMESNISTSEVVSTSIIESTFNIADKSIIDNDNFKSAFEETKIDFTKLEMTDIKLKLDRSGVLESAVQEHHKTVKIRRSSIIESTNSFNMTIPDDEKLQGMSNDNGTNDGLITTGDKESKIKIPGCIVKKLKRENIIPIYIEDTCLGYYYIEIPGNIDPFSEGKLTDPLYSNKSLNRTYLNSEDNSKKDDAIKYISGQMSRYIDAKFINNNQDLRKEIYLILKHNELYNAPERNNLKVTFLPPEDVVHMYFNKDQYTNRGVSDLEKAILPATLYSSLYITNTLGVLTRGQDKRVYYVKQNIDTNISKSLLNTINQIKKSNFGAREIANMKYILNITGRFNDYVIPMSQSGDPPIQFEVMQGQSIDVKTELMTMLEQIAVNSTDVPFELIQLRQSVDYALQLTMTNSKFLRKIFKRQSRTEILFTELINKIYNYEFGKNIQLSATLPPPSFLNITNTNTMLDNNEQFVAKIIDIECSDSDDEKMKAVFKKKLSRYYLSTFLDFGKIETLKQQAENEVAKIQKDTE